jgi:hypothetical protein
MRFFVCPPGDIGLPSPSPYTSYSPSRGCPFFTQFFSTPARKNRHNKPDALPRPPNACAKTRRSNKRTRPPPAAPPQSRPAENAPAADNNNRTTRPRGRRAPPRPHHPPHAPATTRPPLRLAATPRPAKHARDAAGTHAPRERQSLPPSGTDHRAPEAPRPPRPNVSNIQRQPTTSGHKTPAVTVLSLPFTPLPPTPPSPPRFAPRPPSQAVWCALGLISMGRRVAVLRVGRGVGCGVFAGVVCVVGGGHGAT